jgi:hypothetical protein
VRAVQTRTTRVLPHCNVYCPDSMLACCSELRFSRLKIIFACDLTSASSVSTWGSFREPHIHTLTRRDNAYLLIIN